MHDRHSARTTPSSHEANSAREIVAPPEGSESIRPPMQAVRAPRCRATLPNQTPSAATAAAPAAPNLQRSPPMAGYRHSPYGTSRGSDADLATEDVDVSLTAPPPYGPTSPRQHLQNQHHPPHHQQLRQTGGDQHHHPIRQHQHHPMHHQQHQHQGHPMQQQQQQQQHPLNVTYPHQHHPQRNSPHSGGFSGAASGWKNPSASAGCYGPPHASPGWVGAGPALPPSASPPTRFAPPPPPPSRLSRELCCADSDTPAHLVGELLYSLGRRWTHKVESWLNHHPRLRPSVPPPSASTYVTVEAWLERLGCWYEANFGNIARQQSRTQRRHRYSDSASRGSFAAASRESASPSLSGSAASLEGM